MPDLNAPKPGRRRVRKGDPPTAKQLHVLQYIARRCEQGWPPSLAEIGTACYPGSNHDCGRQAARACVLWLERKGLVRRTPRISRGLQLTEHGKATCKEA